MTMSAEQHTEEIIHASEEERRKKEEEKQKEGKGSGNLEVRRADLPAMIFDAQENRVELVNGRTIRVKENKVVPEVLLDIEEARVEEDARDDARAIMASMEQRIDDIRRDNPADAEEQIHQIEALAAVQLAKEVESIRPEHALTSTLNSIFLSFPGNAYRVDQQPKESGESKNSPVDDWKFGNRFDMAAHAYVIPHSQAGTLRSLLENPPVARCLEGKVGFNDINGQILRDDFLDGEGGSTEVGFTVQFRYDDGKGNSLKQDIMFFYGKETSNAVSSEASNDNEMQGEMREAA